MMGWYYAKALGKIADVTTIGPQFAGAVSHIPVLPNEPLLKHIPDLFAYDFYLQVYSKPGYFPPDICEIYIPKVWYVYDTHIHLDVLATTCHVFDLIFCPNAFDRDRLFGLGIPNVEVLEFAADKDSYFIPHRPSKDKHVAIGFAGSVNNHTHLKERKELLEEVASRFPLKIENRTLSGPRVAEFYSDCRIVLNHAIGHEVNMRISEALMSGSLLLTPVVEGIEKYIDIQKSVITYNRDNLFDKIAEILAQPERFDDIAKYGQQEVLERHTYEHRARELVTHTTNYLEKWSPGGPPSKNPWLIKSAELRYRLAFQPGHAFRIMREPWFAPRGLCGKLLGLAFSAITRFLKLLEFLPGRSYFNSP